MTREEVRKAILESVKTGSKTPTQALAELRQLDEEEKKLSRSPPRFKVAEKSGWCSVYFHGLRRPCTLPSALWLELIETENFERFRKFLADNKSLFRNK